MRLPLLEFVFKLACVFVTGVNGFPKRKDHRSWANERAMAAVNADGRVASWGQADKGGSGFPTTGNAVSVYTSANAMAALKSDGKVVAWGSGTAGSGAPTDSGYVEIFSTSGAFVAMKEDGSIACWGNCVNSPSDAGYNDFSSTYYGGMVLIKEGGTLTCFGHNNYGGNPSDCPTGDGFVKVFSNYGAFVALKHDGSLASWGSGGDGGSGAPTDSGYVDVTAAWHAFCARKADGTVVSWGAGANGGSGFPSDGGYINVFSTSYAFAALKADGSLTCWGDQWHGGSGTLYNGCPTSGHACTVCTGADKDPPPTTPVSKVYAIQDSFAAIMADGSVYAWGGTARLGIPSGTDFVNIYTTTWAVLAERSDGTFECWGGANYGCNGEPKPTDGGYVEVVSTGHSFTGRKADGSLTSWGAACCGGSGPPTGAGWSLNFTWMHDQNLPPPPPPSPYPLPPPPPPAGASAGEACVEDVDCAGALKCRCSDAAHSRRARLLKKVSPRHQDPSPAKSNRPGSRNLLFGAPKPCSHVCG